MINRIFLLLIFITSISCRDRFCGIQTTELYVVREIGIETVPYAKNESPSFLNETAHNLNLEQYTGPLDHFLSKARKAGKKLVEDNSSYRFKPDSLSMMIFNPPNEGCLRPAILLFYGGGFITGGPDNPSIFKIAMELAKRGHIVCSVDYRDGKTLQLAGAMHMAIQDARKALDFIYSLAPTLNIDEERISIGGISSGAITALHAAFMNDDQAVEDRIYDLDSQYGSISQSFSEKPPIHAVINICGAVYKTEIIDEDDKVNMVISFHGVKDAVVKNDCSIPIPKTLDSVNDFFNHLRSALRESNTVNEVLDRYEVHKMCGSMEIHAKATKQNIKSYYTEFPNADHNLITANGNLKQSGKKIINEISKRLYDYENDL